MSLEPEQARELGAKGAAKRWEGHVPGPPPDDSPVDPFDEIWYAWHFLRDPQQTLRRPRQTSDKAQEIVRENAELIYARNRKILDRAERMEVRDEE